MVGASTIANVEHRLPPWPACRQATNRAGLTVLGDEPADYNPNGFTQRHCELPEIEPRSADMARLDLESRERADSLIGTTRTGVTAARKDRIIPRVKISAQER